MIRWLHISDLHIGKNSQAQAVAIKYLFRAIQDASNGKPFDFVIISGDLTNSGLKEQFCKFEELIIGPIKKSELFASAQIISVPGNHDIDCNSVLPVMWSKLGKDRQAIFFDNTSDGIKVRNQRSIGFQNYSDFLNKNKICGVDPQMEVAKINTFTIRDEEIKFITVNTALFSDHEANDKNEVPVPLPAIRSLLASDEGNSSSKIIIVGHHPTSWFTHESTIKFDSFLYTNSAVYIHGHMHNIQIQSNQKGLRSLGFGAAYLQTLDSNTTPNYKNSFAICEFEDDLDVAVFSWEADHDTWRTPSDLPVDFATKSKQLEHGYSLLTPFSRISQSKQRPVSEIEFFAEKVFDIFWLEGTDKTKWSNLLIALRKLQNTSSLIDFNGISIASGTSAFIANDDNGRQLVYAVSAPGHMLSYSEVENLNTKMDSEDLNGVIIVTLGGVTDDAENLSEKLSRNKQFNLISKETLKKQIFDIIPKTLNDKVRSRYDSKTNLSYVIHNSKIYALFEDSIQRKWFCLASPTGEYLNETDPLVKIFQITNPYYKGINYAINDSLISMMQKTENSEFEPFSKEKYSSECYALFDDIKYAPLAAIGLKFSDAKLHELYVPAKAEIQTSAEQNESYGRQVKDILDSLGVDESLREQLESIIRDAHKIPKAAETSSASQIYQQHTNLLVLGDPGSGKTCFVKNEILEYCTSKNKGKTWYSEHIPIYIPLSDAAKLLEMNDFKEICLKIIARQGLTLYPYQLEKLLLDGQIAFFFDGLDEVASIEQRSVLIDWIKEILKKYSSYGNRFVITSRPAAVQVLELPKEFVTIHLQGLTDSEMQILATKVMSARINSHITDTLSASDQELVEQLIRDCSSTPGIRRIARNPLLLTFLVLIYANSGPLAAKRHKIYAQAVKTLVAVRNREAGNRVLSESDLRRILGQLALAIFRSQIDDIPSRDEVVSLLESNFGEEARSSSKKDAAKKFLQEVAESTGLVLIHQRSNESLKHISFMHFSFLEYYAAAGFLIENNLDRIYSLAKNPRWREVITLMTGIKSEQDDVTDFIKILLDSRSYSDSITLRHLLFAFDCAQETDVPPERLQHELAKAAFNSIVEGPGRVDSDYRTDIAAKISKLLESCGSPHIKDILIKGLSEKSPQIRSAFIDIVAKLKTSQHLDANIISEFENALDESNSLVITTCLEAVERHPDLRIDKVQNLITKGLNGPVNMRFATLKVIEKVPAFSKDLETELKLLLDDSHKEISSLAAQSILKNGISVSPTSNESKALLSRCLNAWEATAIAGMPIDFSITAPKQEIEGLISSHDIEMRLLGIRLLPLVRQEGRFVHQSIFRILKSATDHEEVTGVIHATRLSVDAFNLITIGDTDYLSEKLSAPTRDVRLATVKLFADLPSHEQVIAPLMKHANKLINEGDWSEELHETLKGIARHGNKNSTACEFIINQTSHLLRNGITSSFGDSSYQKTLADLLRVCRNFDNYSGAGFCSLLKTLGDNFRTPEEIRSESIHTLGKLALPSTNYADFLIKYLKSPNETLSRSAIYGLFELLKRSRKRFEYIKTLQVKFDDIKNELEAAWKRYYFNMTDQVDSSQLKYIRRALLELDFLEISYSEYADRVKLTQGVK
jgi:predicted MPP superfamily phosphohydrolase